MKHAGQDDAAIQKATAMVKHVPVSYLNTEIIKIDIRTRHVEISHSCQSKSNRNIMIYKNVVSFRSNESIEIVVEMYVESKIDIYEIVTSKFLPLLQSALTNSNQNRSICKRNHFEIIVKVV